MNFDPSTAVAETAFDPGSAVPEDAPPLQAVAQQVVRTRPEAAAEVVRLSRRFPAPIEVIERNVDDFQMFDAAEGLAERLSSAPLLRSRVQRDARFGMLAQDDIGALSSIEQAIRTIKNAPAAVASAFPRAGAGLYGALAAPFEVFGQGLRAVENVLADAAGGSRDTAPNLGEAIGQGLRDRQRSAQEVSSGIYTAPADAGIVERGIGSGLQSAAQTLLTLPIALRQGGEAAALGVMGAITGGLSYGKGRDEGLSPAAATVYGTQDAVAEIVTERAALFKLVGDVKAGTGLAKTAMNFLLREVPGELAATLWQNFNEWANVNPDKGLSQWVAEQPEALAETIVATLVGGGAQVGAAKVIDRVMSGARGQQDAAQRAEQAAVRLEELSKLGESTKLKGLEAQSFREFVAQVAEEDGDAPAEVYVDGQQLLNSLNQSGITRAELEAIAPVVAQQLDEALTGDVRVPVSEFMAASEDFTASLIDYLRVEPNAMNRAEAKVFMAERGDALMAEVEAELTAQDAQLQFTESIAGVQAKFQAELDSTKRFTSDVNKAYASLLANFYGTQAQRLGITPDELLERYGVKVRAQSVGGARTMDQAPALEAVRAAWDAAGIKSSITESGNTIELDQIVVPEGRREQGVGTQAMRELLAYADATGKRVALTPSSDFGGNKARLVKFYKGLGFKENKGRSRDFTTRAGMLREPVKPLNQAPSEGARSPLTPREAADARKRVKVLQRILECLNG
jgi:GNAT superfamily N-acetyltransferase